MCVCVHVRACMCVCVCACMHVCMSMHACVCACVHACVCACMHVCMCIHVCACTWVCVYMCMHAGTSVHYKERQLTVEQHLQKLPDLVVPTPDSITVLLQDKMTTLVTAAPSSDRAAHHVG